MLSGPLRTGAQGMEARTWALASGDPGLGLPVATNLLQWRICVWTCRAVCGVGLLAGLWVRG